MEITSLAFAKVIGVVTGLMLSQLGASISLIARIDLELNLTWTARLSKPERPPKYSTLGFSRPPSILMI